MKIKKNIWSNIKFLPKNEITLIIRFSINYLLNHISLDIMDKHTFLKFFKLFYFEFIIIVIGILLSYIFSINPLVFIVISILVIIGGGIYIYMQFHPKLEERISIPLYSKIWSEIRRYLSSFIFYSIITVVAIIFNVIFFLRFGLLWLFMLFIISIIIIFIGFIILVIYTHYF